MRRGELRATVILPRSTGAAVEAIARTLRTRELPPTSLLLKPESYPPEAEVHPALKVDAGSALQSTARSASSSRGTALSGGSADSYSSETTPR